MHDDYFIERKLYPNVDFYSGVIYRAIGIPVNMFTVLFAIGRLPGWIAHWMEIAPPRQKSAARGKFIPAAVIRDYMSLLRRDRGQVTGDLTARAPTMTGRRK